MATSAEKFYSMHGFSLTGTGGNCTAFRRVFAKKNGLPAQEILITVKGDCVAPSRKNQAVHVGLYGREHSEAVAEFDADNGDDVVTGLMQLWGINPPRG